MRVTTGHLHIEGTAAAAERVVITGAGLVTSLGLDVASTWARVVRGECGFRSLTAVESALPSDATGGQAVDLPDHERDSLPREVAYLRRAVREALHQSRVIVGQPYAPARCGLVMGTTLHGMRHAGRFMRDGDYSALTRFLAGSTLARAADGLGFGGAAMTLCSACSSGLASIAAAVTLLQAGVVDLVLAGGYDPMSEYSYGGFSSMRLVSAGAVRPFSRLRDGMKVGEGYGVVVLELAEGARGRGIEPLAEILGFGESCDAYHLSRPHPEGAGAAAAIRGALRRARSAPAEIDLIAAHATATAENDPAEFAALSSVFDGALSGVPVVGFKSHVGHTLGAAGAVELILSLMAIREQVIPPCANSTPDDVAFPGLRLATGDARRASVRRTMTSSLGFGGSNTCVVLGQPDGKAREAVAPRTSNVDDVVISGMGVVLPGITGIEAFARYLADSRTGLARAAVGAIPGAEVDAILSARRARRVSDYVKLTLAATSLAYRDAAVEDTATFGEECSAVLGTTHGSTIFTERYYRQIVEEGIDAANPMLFAEGVPNAAAAHLATTFAIKGLCQTAIGTRTAGLEALLLAVTRIRTGVWERAIVATAEEHSPVVNEAYRHAGIRGGRRASGDRADGGFATSCGAVTLILERESAARKRGVVPWGVVEAVAAGHFTQARRGPATVRHVWSSLGRSCRVLCSANGTWVDDVERLGLRLSQCCAGAEAPMVGAIQGHLAETFSVGPLAGLAGVLALGALPAWRLAPPPGLRASAGTEPVTGFVQIATDYNGSVVGARLRRGPRPQSKVQS